MLGKELIEGLDVDLSNEYGAAIHYSYSDSIVLIYIVPH